MIPEDDEKPGIRDEWPIQEPEIIDDVKLKAMQAEREIEKVKLLLKERRKLLKIHYWHGDGLAAELVNIFRAYENNLASARDNVDTYLEHILAALYGIRFSVNAMLNETWTHRQKDAQMLAIGAMVETGIKQIKKDQHEVATRYRMDDPFTPSWSRDGIHKRMVEAETVASKQREKIQAMEQLLTANGIDPTVQPVFSDDQDEIGF